MSLPQRGTTNHPNRYHHRSNDDRSLARRCYRDTIWQLLLGTLIREWRGQDTCAPLSEFTASYAFLWHGIAIEDVSSLPVCTEEYAISRGGLPDLRTYFVPLLVQP